MGVSVHEARHNDLVGEVERLNEIARGTGFRTSLENHAIANDEVARLPPIHPLVGGDDYAGLDLDCFRHGHWPTSGQLVIVGEAAASFAGIFSILRATHISAWFEDMTGFFSSDSRCLRTSSVRKLVATMMTPSASLTSAFLANS